MIFTATIVYEDGTIDAFQEHIDQFDEHRLPPFMFLCQELEAVAMEKFYNDKPVRQLVVTCVNQKQQPGGQE